MKKNKDLEFERNFYEDLIKDKPDYTDALIPLGNIYTQTGEYKKGLEIDKRLVKLKPDDPIIFYNLACSYSLLNDIKQSLSALEKAIKVGYKDLDFIYQDKDLKNLKKTKVFQKLIEKYFK